MARDRADQPTGTPVPWGTVPLILDNRVRAYAWGSPTVIPDLLGVPPTGEPQAELWMGAHPGAPSMVDVAGDRLTLAKLIERVPDGMLGPECVRRFGPRLPYLLKILAVERPLSIQAHPTNEQAARGFAAEEAAGIPIDAPNRSYRDRSHKPEMVVALTGFEALLGFRDPIRTAELIDTLGVPELRDAASRLRAEGGAALEPIVRQWLELTDAEAADLVSAVAAAAGSVGEGADLTADGAAGGTAAAGDPAGGAGGTAAPPDEASRLATLVRRLARWYPGDRGILLALLLRQVRLGPGEAAFTAAGVPHAYLGGVAIEPQASSDNTLRAGLTPKHVDTAELRRILRYEPAGDPAVPPVAGVAGELRYVPGMAEFRLSRFDLTGPAATVTALGPRIVLVTGGAIDVTTGAGTVRLGRGRSAFVPASDGPVTLAGRGTAFVVAPDLAIADQG
jgi:mannose-6-phosphate isomerase